MNKPVARFNNTLYEECLSIIVVDNCVERMDIARIKEDKRAASESAALAEEGMPEAAMNNNRVADSTRRSTVNAEVAGVSRRQGTLQINHFYNC